MNMSNPSASEHPSKKRRLDDQHPQPVASSLVTGATVDQLPPDELSVILGFLDPDDLATASRLCQKLQQHSHVEIIRRLNRGRLNKHQLTVDVAFLKRLSDQNRARIICLVMMQSIKGPGLRRLSGLQSLTCLSLRGCELITDAGLAHLSGLVRSLRILHD